MVSAVEVEVSGSLELAFQQTMAHVYFSSLEMEMAMKTMGFLRRGPTAVRHSASRQSISALGLTARSRSPTIFNPTITRIWMVEISTMAPEEWLYWIQPSSTEPVLLRLHSQRERTAKSTS